MHEQTDRMKRLFKWTLWLLFLGILCVVFSNIIIISKTKSRVISEKKELNGAKVALVLGTSKFTRVGAENLFFKDRMRAAAELYKEGKVKHIIVSGDNRTQYYNEPKDMLAALQELDIPAEAITLDYAGLRTLDSIIRCKEVFGQTDVIIVTQRFHAYRAMFIADYYGLDAQAYMANFESETYSTLLFREAIARMLAVADLYVLNKEPKFLGEKEELNIK